MPHGPVVEMLMERGFQVFAVNPKQLDRFTVAGAKDDSRDAHVLGDSLRTDRHAFRPLAVDDPAIIELREWSCMAEDQQEERSRLDRVAPAWSGASHTRGKSQDCQSMHISPASGIGRAEASTR